MKYSSYSYIYPPRPKNAVNPDDLSFWENTNSLLFQPKLNGSNTTIYCNGKDIFVMNRHHQRLTNFRIGTEEILSLYRGKGWLVLNGEYMNKSKRDESGEVFNHKFIIFDLLVYDNDYLVGKTFQERVELLDELYGQVDSDKQYLYSISENVYRVKSFDNGFRECFDDWTQVDMIEGIVMKRKAARLERGNTENNNSKSQLKSRKKTKLYKF